MSVSDMENYNADELKDKASAEFGFLYEIIKQLRSPEGGCPWDIAQSPITLRTTLLEETYEAIEAIEEACGNSKKAGHAAEELGDVLLNAIMIAYMFEQENIFSVASMIRELTEKLIRRHPHVFGKTEGFETQESANKPQTPEKVLAQWDTIKEKLEGRKSNSVMDCIPKTLPPLTRAYKLQKKAAKKGFDWDCAADTIHKIKEELQEFTESLENGSALDQEEELGDLLFILVNAARHLHIDPTLALNRTNAKFEYRFRYIEQRMNEEGLECSRENLEQMEKFWEEAKLKKRQAQPEQNPTQSGEKL